MCAQFFYCSMNLILEIYFKQSVYVKMNIVYKLCVHCVYVHVRMEQCSLCCVLGSPKAKEVNSKSADSATDSAERSGKFYSLLSTFHCFELMLFIELQEGHLATILAHSLFMDPTGLGISLGKLFG